MKLRSVLVLLTAATAGALLWHWGTPEGSRAPAVVSLDGSEVRELHDAGRGDETPAILGSLLSFDLQYPPVDSYFGELEKDDTDEFYRREVEYVSGGHAVYDPWMRRAARELGMQRAISGSEPPESAVSFFLRSAGAPETAAAQLFVKRHERTDAVGKPSDKELRRVLRDVIANVLASIPKGEGIPVIGIGNVAIDDPPFNQQLVILGARRNFRLDPTPRLIALASTWTIRGSFPSGFSDAHASVLMPDGTLAAGSLSRTGERDFVLRVQAGEVVGTIYVSVDGVGAKGPEKLLQLQAEVGDAIPTHFDTLVPAPESFASQEEAEAYAVELLNRDRVELGLAPLRLDRRLQAIARAHSEDMRDSGFFGHLSPTTGLAAERIAAARYKASLHGENLALNNSIAEAQASLLESVGHRRNIVDRSYTHVGIGAVRDRASSAGRQGMWYVTQLFARPVTPLDPVKASLDYLEAINSKRAETKTPAMGWDERLGLFAEQACEPSRTSLDGFAAELANEASEIAVASVAIHIQRLYTLSSLKVEGALLKDSYRRVGLALCQDPEDLRGAVLVIAVAAAGTSGTD